jgi:hypothetical protein
VSDDYRMDTPNLGPCCVCERTVNVNSVFMLDRRGAIPGTGWGCVVCSLPADGAVAVLCDECVRTDKEPIFACLGYPATSKRIRISDLPTGPFVHDLARHSADDSLAGHRAEEVRG